MRIELLPKWIFPDSSPAFYDTESVTVTQSIAKLYPKINELISDYNKFAEEWNQKIGDFEFSTIEELNLFKVSLRQEFQDFIDVINVKVKLLEETLSSETTSDESIINDLNSIVERLEELEANSDGGSAKLYKHRVYISTIYNEETWAEDPDFRFYLNFYRTSNTPITSFDEIQAHEMVLEGGFKLIRYDGPDANHIAIRVFKNSSGNLAIEYIEDIDISSGSYTNTSVWSSDYFYIEDTVSEV